MGFRNMIACLTAGLAAASTTLLLSGVALAHAPITSVAWDNQTNPTKVIATSGEDDISTKPGSFYLKVFDVNNNEVDLGDTKVLADSSMMSVSVKPNLPAGGYRVDWMTVSADDGDEADSLPGNLPSLTLLLNKPAAAPATAPAPVTAPAPAISTAPVQSAPVPTAPRVQTAPGGFAPPNTGDGGLLGAGEGSGVLAVVGVLAAAMACISIFSLSRRRA